MEVVRTLNLLRRRVDPKRKRRASRKRRRAPMGRHHHHQEGRAAPGHQARNGVPLQAQRGTAGTPVPRGFQLPSGSQC